ncbi:pyruvate, water dikinase regulatory protein [Propionivibrio sp.]|uniref:pyruvate, water dikinase regulatory protein n=1 Tax=Propionivibrio sp. TaxID=2212460 RepID=UPI00272E1003|nr:pyruvate, water dikinase regulatory protein [Propionivibrio sp.]
MKKKININLISHASGELVEMLARNAVTQLEGVEVKRRLWKMVRRLDQVPQILTELETSPGFVIHSISHDDVREALEEGCRQLHIPFQFALEPLIGRLAKFSDAPVKYYTSSGDAFDEDYYRRIEAMKYTLAHDDGIGGNDLETADVVVVGVSRSTKTPTCMYLASRGVKAANVPLVPGAPPPASLLRLKGPLVVGLTINPARLALIRTARLKSLNDEENTTYADQDLLRKEIIEAKRLFIRCGWPIIDVSNRSIEQTAAMIIDLLRKSASDSAQAEQASV